MTTINIRYGDTDGTLDSKAKGQILWGINGEINYLYGDAQEIINSRGGNDVLIGGEGTILNVLYGDAYVIEASQGGNDVLIGGAGANLNYLYGDAMVMCESQGGNDMLIAGKNSNINIMFGDAESMTYSHGGNDVLKVDGPSARASLFGDAYFLERGTGGNDQLFGADNTYQNSVMGDAYVLNGGWGGNDILKGGSQSLNNMLCGDAYFIEQEALFATGSVCDHDSNWTNGDNEFTNYSKAGNDVIYGGDQTEGNTLYGDAVVHISGNVVCGNDRLISGTGRDEMWGDIGHSYDFVTALDLSMVRTGHDVFVFAANNGDDIIYDFRHGEDKIELQGLAVDSFAALSAGGHLSVSGADSVITFGSNTITVVGVTALAAEDFLFA